jgi:hypothetical protein
VKVHAEVTRGRLNGYLLARGQAEAAEARADDMRGQAETQGRDDEATLFYEAEYAEWSRAGKRYREAVAEAEALVRAARRSAEYAQACEDEARALADEVAA